jgi:hypothetical protein
MLIKLITQLQHEVNDMFTCLADFDNEGLSEIEITQGKNLWHIIFLIDKKELKSCDVTYMTKVNKTWVNCIESEGFTEALNACFYPLMRERYQELAEKAQEQIREQQHADFTQSIDAEKTMEMLNEF